MQQQLSVEQEVTIRNQIQVWKIANNKDISKMITDNKNNYRSYSYKLNYKIELTSSYQRQVVLMTEKVH